MTRLALLGVVALALPGAAASGAGGLFGYDPTATLDVRVASTQVRDTVEVRDISFASPRGGRADAYLLLPPGNATVPVILWAPGSNADRSDQLREALVLAQRGAASLIVQPPSARPGGKPFGSCDAGDRAQVVQHVVDLRRGLDLLAQTPRIDMTRVGYVGFSLGTAVGSGLAGSDRRVKFVSFMSGVAHTSAVLRSFCRSTLRGAALDAYTRGLRAIDPSVWLPRAKQARALFQFGSLDPNVSRAEATAFTRAARGTKTVKWYRGKHDLVPRAYADRDAWLVARLGLARRTLAAAGGWQIVHPGGRTGCARGGKYAFWARIARPDRVLFFFQGGGGCFDVRTCAPGSTWFDDSVDELDNPTYERGILDLADSRNPFRGWSIVFIPSCGGDVHLGDRTSTYGTGAARVVIRHRGWVNAHAALAWAFARFRSPKQVFVTGCSAGSVGSAFHVPAIIGRYPRAQVTQLGDSLAFVFHRPIRLVDWGAQNHFPQFFRIGTRRFTMTQYVEALTKRYPRRVFARFNYAHDPVQEQFYEAVGGEPGGFAPRLRTAEQRLMKRPNYRSYLACGATHCVLPRDRFYAETVGGVRLRDWVAKLAAGRDVGCPACRSG